MDFNDKYNFEAQWYEKTACSYRKFYLHYYPADNSVELVSCEKSQTFIKLKTNVFFSSQFDIKNRKTFLRKTVCDDIRARDIYVGSKVTIFSRCIEITNYADEATKNKLEKKIQKRVSPINSFPLAFRY